MQLEQSLSAAGWQEQHRACCQALRWPVLCLLGTNTADLLRNMRQVSAQKQPRRRRTTTRSLGLTYDNVACVLGALAPGEAAVCRCDPASHTACQLAGQYIICCWQQSLSRGGRRGAGVLLRGNSKNGRKRGSVRLFRSFARVGKTKCLDSIVSSVQPASRASQTCSSRRPERRNLKRRMQEHEEDMLRACGGHPLAAAGLTRDQSQTNPDLSHGSRSLNSVRSLSCRALFFSKLRS